MSKIVVSAREVRPGDQMISPGTAKTVVVVSRHYDLVWRNHEIECTTLEGEPSRRICLKAGSTVRVTRSEK